MVHASFGRAEAGQTKEGKRTRRGEQTNARAWNAVAKDLRVVLDCPMTRCCRFSGMISTD